MSLMLTKKDGKEQAQHPDKPAFRPVVKGVTQPQNIIPHRNSTNIQGVYFSHTRRSQREVIVAVGPESQP